MPNCRRCACAALNMRSLLTTSATSTPCVAVWASSRRSRRVIISPEEARAPPLPVPTTGIASTCLARPHRGGAPRAARSAWALATNCDAASRYHASSGRSVPATSRSAGAKRPSRCPSQTGALSAAPLPSTRCTRLLAVKDSRGGWMAPSGGPSGNHLRLFKLRVGTRSASDDSRSTSPCITNTWPGSMAPAASGGAAGGHGGDGGGGAAARRTASNGDRNGRLIGCSKSKGQAVRIWWARC